MSCELWLLAVVKAVQSISVIAGKYPSQPGKDRNGGGTCLSGSLRFDLGVLGQFQSIPPTTPLSLIAVPQALKPSSPQRPQPQYVARINTGGLTWK
jgi:hypothetical protein